MSFKEYKKLDIIIFTIIVTIAEILTIFGYKLLGSMFYVTFSTVIALISIIRWGYIAVITYIPAIIIRVIWHFNYSLIESCEIYLCELIFFCLIPILFLKFKKKRENINQKNIELVGYVVYSYLLLLLGRSIGLSIVTRQVIESVIACYSESIFEIFISVLLILVVNKSSKLIIQDVYSSLKKREGEKINES